MGTLSDGALRELRSMLGGGKVLWKEEDLHSYAFDASFGYHLPEAVAQPEKTEEVSGLLRFANRHRIR